MRTRRLMTYLTLVIMLALLAGAQGCYLIGPTHFQLEDDPEQNIPDDKGNPYPYPYPEPGKEQVANPQPKADPEAEPEALPPNGEKPVWFEESDCTVEGLSGLQVDYGPGYLGCNYSWEGFYSDPSEAIIEITEISDPERLTSQLESDVSGAQASADSKSTNETLSIIHNDANGFIFVATYLGGPGSQSDENPLCVRGAGYEKANDRFLVYFRLSICSTTGTNTDYVKTMESMEDTALAAITRVMEKSTNP
jgi:hypothetical protein